MMPQSADSNSGLQDYLQATPIVKYGVGQQIYEKSTADLCYLLSGVVDLRWRNRHCAFALPGDFFGEFEDNSHASAIVKVECELMRWNPAYLRGRVHSMPELGCELIKLQAQRNQRLKEMLAINNRSIKQRLIWHLLSLTRQFQAAGLTRPMPEPLARDAVMLPKWITHLVLSDVIGTSREIVTQTLGALARTDAFRGRRGHWQVVPSAMEKLMKEKA